MRWCQKNHQQGPLFHLHLTNAINEHSPDANCRPSHHNNAAVTIPAIVLPTHKQHNHYTEKEWNTIEEIDNSTVTEDFHVEISNILVLR